MPAAASGAGSRLGTLRRVARYAVFRAAILALMVIAGVFLAVVVLNYGGYIDRIHQANIEEALLFVSLDMSDQPPEAVKQATAELRQSLEEMYGMHRPFLLRCVRWTYEGLTLDWGNASYSFAVNVGLQSETQSVRQILFDALPKTLLLAGTANLLLFVASIVVALSLSRQHGSLFDRAIITLSPISSIPNWVYGILLTVLLAGELHLLPFGGMFDEFPPATKIGYVPIVLKHMVLPVLAIFLSQFFQTVYAWRTYFLIHSGEDYIELARAQGLPDRMIERRYVLRPALPYVVTSFMLMLITFWQGILVLETFFDWPGIGRLFLAAIWRTERPMTVAVIVLFALLLALSVFALDIVYALVDPRVKIGGRSQALRPASGRRRRRFAPFTRPVRRPPEPKRAWAVAPLPGAGDDAPPPGRRRRRPGSGLAGLAPTLREMVRYPSAMAGLAIVVLLIGVAVYTVIAVPYRQAVEGWRPESVEKYHLPKNAQPAWVNLFRRDPLPLSVVQNSRAGTAHKTVEAAPGVGSRTVISFTFDYPYGGFPQDLAVYFGASYTVKKPFVALTWLTPDGRTFDLGGFSIVSGQTYQISKDIPRKYLEATKVRSDTFMRGTGGAPAVDILFAGPDASPAGEAIPVQGRYTLRVDGYTFEPDSAVDAEMVLPGQVYGLAGTDNQRRDLMLALLWGTPVALAFGFLGAVATSLLSMLIAAAGAWFGGWLDELIQRLTEINMILPALPMAVMVFYLYSHSIWAILGVIVLLNVFGSSVKNYRAAFLQVKETPYVEAARTYGAGPWRIVRRYLVPRILPLLIPQLVILIPTYVFFEATLAYLQISDPNMPTWGKVVYDALTGGAFEGHYYWVLEPIALMMITGLAFAMVGFALDSILNPRLRRM